MLGLAFSFDDEQVRVAQLLVDELLGHFCVARCQVGSMRVITRISLLAVHFELGLHRTVCFDCDCQRQGMQLNSGEGLRLQRERHPNSDLMSFLVRAVHLFRWTNGFAGSIRRNRLLYPR